MGETDALRTRLLALRRDALRQLAESDGLDAGLLALVADASAALTAIEAEAEISGSEVQAEPLRS